MHKRTKNCVLWEDYLKEESVHLTLRHGTACPAEWWQLDQPHHSIRDASLLTWQDTKPWKIPMFNRKYIDSFMVDFPSSGHRHLTELPGEKTVPSSGSQPPQHGLLTNFPKIWDESVKAFMYLKHLTGKMDDPHPHHCKPCQLKRYTCLRRVRLQKLHQLIDPSISDAWLAKVGVKIVFYFYLVNLHRSSSWKAMKQSSIHCLYKPPLVAVFSMRFDTPWKFDTPEISCHPCGLPCLRYVFSHKALDRHDHEEFEEHESEDSLINYSRKNTSKHLWSSPKLQDGSSFPFQFLVLLLVLWGVLEDRKNQQIYRKSTKPCSSAQTMNMPWKWFVFVEVRSISMRPAVGKNCQVCTT